jgi:hypothetical protein
MDNYSSHLKILELVSRESFNFVPNESALEFGPGKWSSPLLKNKFKNLNSIEQMSEEWHKKTLHSGSIWCPGALEFKELGLGKFDLIFVDGHNESRPEQVMWAFEHSDLVVVHDTEEPIYKWERIKVPNIFVCVEVVQERPWTTVYTKNHNVVTKLKNHFNCLVNGEPFYFNYVNNAIVWTTKYGTQAFVIYQREFAMHLRLQKLGLDSRFLCNFPKSEKHKEAELAGCEIIIDLEELKKCQP